jgi:cytochrome c oxidase subunit II
VSLQSVAPPLTEQAEDIDRVWDGFLLAALAVGAFVLVLLLFVVVRYRRRGDVLPRQVHENLRIEITYIVVPVLIVIALFAVTYVTVEALDEVDDDVDLVVEVIGFQWQWQFNYVEAGVEVVGGPRLVPELVLPAGRSVRFDLESLDVIHSFFIPGFRYKRDMFPGQTQTFQVDVGARTGTFEDAGVCAEFCGLDHHQMRFGIRVVTPEEFDTWLAEQEDTT